MITLPIPLPAGVVAVYGNGITTSQSGIIATENFLFGTVYQIYDGGGAYLATGQNIMFNKNNIIDRLQYNGATFTLVPARLATKDSPPA